MRVKVSNKNFTINKKADLFSGIQERVASQERGATVIVPHVCNNIDLFGGGFAASVAKHYPIVKENFHMLGKKAKLGHTQFISAYQDKKYGHEIVFANMIAQNNIRNTNNTRPLNYIALAYCLNDIRLYTLKIMKQKDNAVEIHCPKFGSGLAGGDWKFITQMIEDSWIGIKNIYVYSL